MINPNRMCQSIKATWVKRILDGWKENWKIFVRKKSIKLFENNLIFYIHIRDIEIISCLEKPITYLQIDWGSIYFSSQI